MCLLFNPTSELPVVTFLGRCILLTLVSMLTLLIYASNEELSNRAWWTRTILHVILLEAVLLPLAHNWGFGTTRWMDLFTARLFWRQR